MSNQNEQDNRQMTPVSAAIRDEYDNLQMAKAWSATALTEAMKESYEMEKEKHRYTISVLESLLPKQKEQQESIHEAGFFFGWEECKERIMSQCNTYWDESCEEVYAKLKTH